MPGARSRPLHPLQDALVWAENGVAYPPAERLGLPFPKTSLVGITREAWDALHAGRLLPALRLPGPRAATQAAAWQGLCFPEATAAGKGYLILRDVSRRASPPAPAN